jgi:hypothetical protein
MEYFFSAWEMADVRSMYGRANGNFRETCPLHAERYSQRRNPSYKLFTKFISD